MLSWALADDFQGVCGVFQEVVYCYNVLMQSVRLFFSPDVLSSKDKNCKFNNF